MSAPRGSSPLARGLLGPAALGERAQGIIPARAGFTFPHHRHPTSNDGSSPLARGLRGCSGRRNQRPRIIPARAGFTAILWTAWRSRTDHPRSRGVYEWLVFWSPNGEGSSPLARGLRLRGLDIGDRTRIIPARAGFTWGDAAWALVTADHPRSRGVYAGSAVNDVPVLGIIPARAGFTALRHQIGFQLEDHPRSRGVYGASVPTMSRTIGSSPLARGLP